MAYRKSDQPIVLRERESRLHGEGVDRIRSRQRKHCPDLDRRNNANLPDDNGKLGKYSEYGSDVSLKSPVRENCTLGSVRGTAGNRCSYRAEIWRSTKVCAQNKVSWRNKNMASRWIHIRLLALILICLVGFSCTMRKVFVPNKASRTNFLVGETIALSVVDNRLEKEKSAEMIELFTTQLAKYYPSAKFDITQQNKANFSNNEKIIYIGLNISEYTAEFVDATWHGKIEFSVRLIDNRANMKIIFDKNMGKLTSKFNLWGYKTAEASLVKSFNDAMQELIQFLDESLNVYLPSNIITKTDSIRRDSLLSTSITFSDWFSVPFNVQFSTFRDVYIDGEPISGLNLVQEGKEIRFRGSDELKEKLRYGYHQITAWIDGKKQDFYFWKGLKELKYYQKENLGDSYALIIGVSKYGKGLRNLPEVEAQAKNLGQILETNNFKVTYLLDTEQRVTRQVIDATISELNKQMNVQKDRLFFYYGGHGKAVKPAFGDSLAYLIVNDYDMNDLENTCLSMDDIFLGRYMKQIRAKHILFTIDACVASIGRRLAEHDSASIRQFMDLNLIYGLTNEPGRTIFTAGSGAQEAIDEEGKGGIFTSALINALKGDADLYYGDGNGVTIMNELETYLKARVTSEARLKRWRQDPARFDFGKGQFIFFHNQAEQIK